MIGCFIGTTSLLFGRKWCSMFGSFWRKPLRILGALLLLSWMGAIPVPGAHAQAAPVVRVGYAQLPGFIYQDVQGHYAGYAYDLLQELAGYTGWNYCFVPTAYSEAQDALESGRIDLFVPYRRTSERLTRFAYSAQPFCRNQASLLTLPSADLYYDDFTHFNGLIIGVERSAISGQLFQDYFAQKGCQVTLRQEYNTIPQMKDALDRGEIDAFVSASNRGVTGCKIISELAENDVYLLARHGNRLYLDQFDSAMKEMRQNTPLFENELEQKYRAAASGTYPALTREEAQYIARKGMVTVMVGGQDIDKQTAAFSGGAAQMLRILSERTGLRFTPVTAQTTAQRYENFASGQTDLFFGFDSDYDWAKSHNARLTTAYATFHSVMVRKARADTALRTIAVVRGSYFDSRIKDMATADVVECETYEDGIHMVRTGQVDGMICDAQEGNMLSAQPRNRSLTFTTMYDMMSSYCIAVSRSSDSRLVGILNKSMGSIPQTTINASFVQPITPHPATLSDYLYEDPARMLIAIVGAVAFVLTLLFVMLFLVYTRRQNCRLLSANRAKTEFLARMSHDMRTPLNGILGLTALMREEDDLETLRKDLTQLHMSGEYLLNLVNDTLDVSKIEEGRIELHPTVCQGRDIFMGALNLVRPGMEEKNLTLRLHIERIEFTTLYVDVGRVQQLIMNILSNCIKFTPEGGTIDLTMETLSFANGVLHDQITVRDTGIGIDPAFLPHIFEPFSQENTRITSHYKGTGLGMTICKEIVTLMGGAIEVHSEKGKGSEFILTLDLPVATEEQIAAHERQHALQRDRQMLAGKRVLLCEDNPLNTHIATLLLEKKGVLVEHAQDGSCGVDRFMASPCGYYDGILMDIRMPVMDGLEATRIIRQCDRDDAKTIPIIAMTADALTDDMRKTRAAGMNAHLSKPIDVELLYQTLAHWL